MLPGAGAADVQELYAAIQGQPDVARVEYVPKQKAYDEERQRDTAMADFIDRFGLANPFPDAFRIQPRSAAGYEEVLRLVSGERWRGVIDPLSLSRSTAQEGVTVELLRFLSVAHAAALLLLLACGLTLVFATAAAVRQRWLRRGEAMRAQLLLGARHGDVFLPFACEATALLWSALAIATLLLAALIALPALAGFVPQSSIIQSLVLQMQPLLLTAGPTIVVLEFLLCPLLAAAAVGLGARGESRR